MYVCVCVGVALGFTNSYFTSECVSVCLGYFLCMCVSVLLNLLVTFSQMVFVSVYGCIYIYIYMGRWGCFQLVAFVREHVWHCHSQTVSLYHDSSVWLYLLSSSNAVCRDYRDVSLSLSLLPSVLIYFVSCCFQDLSKTARSLLESFPSSSFFSSAWLGTIWGIYTIVLTRLQYGSIPALF